MYVSYADIIKAIKPWGIVEAILAFLGFLGLNHLFIVRFKQPITITGTHGKGVRADAYGGIDDTPLFLRGMYRDGIAVHNVILSPNKIAFDISNLSVDTDEQPFSGFHSGALLASTKLVPDERLRQYVNKSWSEDLKKEIESIFTRDEKAAKLLKWITASGEAFLQRGISVTSFLGSNADAMQIKEIPTDDIISNYKDNSWMVVHLSL